ncbi:hypothetical protein A3A70_02195 [candidate division WWE3 bacterium RIFCSPLOWO2_01_FULL_42_11]|uniref:GIY-YIG domain-containing protein n=1 Tax=candidate division WWE3 bacterium RIFCSPLOWO2_01_FULL_42_11 TaxID=1802627 RepID=A0A1F4VNJ0_UNCKA|nr:MAG: hypothetical protein A3A70_02195 [candidate division WWE3 bacterium RIFCSPLOWO2_01_FULL_42_11]
MTWETVKRGDSFKGSNRPFISIASDHISFNTLFTKIASIDNSYNVTVYADSENLKMGFEFHKDERPNSLTLTQASSATRGVKRSGVFCAAQGVLNQYKWIKGITKLSTQDRRFYDPKQEQGKWTIQLCPAFEEKRARESENIPQDAIGIYRYVTDNGEIVYIGRGPINGRLKSPDRNDWIFDVIEYSVVKNPDMQVKWEDYWIEKYKEQHDGKKPHYNKVSGFGNNHSND